MNDDPPILATLIGLTLGFITTPLLLFLYNDMPMANVRAAEVVCVEANSKLVSLDRVTATCENRAEIPYEVKK